MKADETSHVLTRREVSHIPVSYSNTERASIQHGACSDAEHFQRPTNKNNANGARPSTSCSKRNVLSLECRGPKLLQKKTWSCRERDWVSPLKLRASQQQHSFIWSIGTISPRNCPLVGSDPSRIHEPKEQGQENGTHEPLVVPRKNAHRSCSQPRHGLGR